MALLNEYFACSTSLDEFDVFMDAVNRKASMKMIVCSKLSKRKYVGWFLGVGLGNLFDHFGLTLKVTFRIPDRQRTRDRFCTTHPDHAAGRQ